MMWFVIILFIVLVLGKFSLDHYNLIQRVKRNGGMMELHRELIGELLTLTNREEILDVENLSVIVGDNHYYGDYYILTQTHRNRIAIQYYNRNNRSKNKESLMWKFHEKEKPEFIKYKIETDVNRFLKLTSNLND